MPAAALERRIAKLLIHRVLFVHDGGHGFECDAKENRLSVRDAALNAPGKIRRGKNLSVFRAKRVVVFASRERDAAETGADLKRLGCGQA